LRTGLAAKTSKSSLGSRACCFSACAGSQTTQDRAIHSRLTWLSCCLSPLGRESASCTNGFSKLNSPAHRYLCLRFDEHLAMLPARLEARMDSLLSFPVGLLHPLQHAGLSRRSPDGRPPCKSLSREKTVLLTRATEERAKTNIFRTRSSQCVPLGGGSCPRRTGHPFAVSGPVGPSQKIKFVFAASPETIRREPLEF
jgi:hypothetical protein